MSRLALFIFALSVLILLSPLPASSTPGERRQTIQFSGLSEIIGDKIHPAVLENATFDPAAVSPVLVEIDSTQSLLTVARQNREKLEQDLVRYRTAEAPMRSAVVEAEKKLATAVSSASQADEALRRVAELNFKAAYVPVLVGENSSDKRHRQVLGQRLDTNVAETQSESARNERERHNTFQTLASAESSLLDKIAETVDKSQGEEAVAAQAERQLAELGPKAVDEILTAPLVDLPFPVVVLDAYYNAEVLIRESRPACQVSWYQLAGIGNVETKHGTFGGTTVEATGKTRTPILGPELNGDKFLAISDTDGGALDNNSVWDHAVGPMQFIPSSWKLFGADGDGDSVNDPHNIYDAALAAANHLCGSRSGLSSTENFTSALMGYNRSTVYGVDVKRYSSEYQQAVSL